MKFMDDDDYDVLILVLVLDHQVLVMVFILQPSSLGLVSSCTQVLIEVNAIHLAL